MTKFPLLSTAAAALAFLAGCGGNDAGDQSPSVAFTQMVNFGDSLSDVGSYRTAFIASYGGGGHYSINGDHSAQGLPYVNWTEYVASTLHLGQPCAAEVGLASVGQLAGLASPPVFNTSCYNYAQGGSRVEQQPGPGNAATYPADPAGQLGQLTVPVNTQVSNYLSAHSRFDASQIVTVLAGGNDVFYDLAAMVDGPAKVYQARVDQNLMTQVQANALITTAATAAVQALATAGTDLATLIKQQIIANGATHVVVVNIPDVSETPYNALYVATSSGAATAALHPNLVLDMTNAFNAALAAGLNVTTGGSDPQSALPQVAFVDAFASNVDQHAHPSAYGLTNLTRPACNLTPTGAGDITATGTTIPVSQTATVYAPIPTSLFCNTHTLIHDATYSTTADPSGTMHYLFADTVHPTPFAYRLLAELVNKELTIKGWL